MTTYPEIVAPGVNILSSGLSGSYEFWSGTSLAAPHVSGALALLLSARRDLSVSNQQAALVQGAVDLGVAGADNTYGNGRLDVKAAYQWLEADDQSPAPIPTASSRLIFPVILKSGLHY